MKIVYFFVFIVLTYSFSFYLGSFNFDESVGYKCDERTREFNGGIKKIGDKYYKVQLCSMYEIVDKSGADKIRINIYQLPDNKLLAQRFYVVNWAFPVVEGLQYTNQSIEYFNADGKTTMEYEKEFIKIPPTFWDELRVNFGGRTLDRH